jgi:transposase
LRRPWASPGKPGTRWRTRFLKAGRAGLENDAPGRGRKAAYGAEMQALIQEWLKFLQQIDAATPADRALHPILDNYTTHKQPKVKKWLEKHPRFHLHFTPTSASWLNMVARCFRDLTVNRLRRRLS